MEATQSSESSSPPKKNIITLDLDNISETDILPLITRLLEQQAKSGRNADDDVETQAQPIAEDVVETVTKLLDRTLTRRHSTRRQKSLERQSSVEDDNPGAPQDVGQQVPENSLIESMIQTEDLVNRVASLTLERTVADEATDGILPLQDSPTTMSALLTIENSSSLDAELDQLTFSIENNQLETHSNQMLNESQTQPSIPSEAPAGNFINTAYSNVFNQERVTEEMRSELFSKVSMMMHQESLQNGYTTGEYQIEKLPTTPQNSNVIDVTMNAETSSSPSIVPPPLPPKDEEKPRPFTRRLTLSSSSDRPLPPKPEELDYQSTQKQHPPPSILSSISVSLPNMISNSVADSRPTSVASYSSQTTPALTVQNELLPPPHRPRPTSDPIGPAVHLSNLESFDSNRHRSRASSVPASANQNQHDQQCNPQNTDSQPPRSKSPHPPRGVSKSRSPVHAPQQPPPDVPPLPTTIIAPTPSVAESPQTPHNVLPNNNYLPRTVAHIPSSQATPPQFFRPFLQGGLQQQPVPRPLYVNSDNVSASHIPPRQASFHSNQAPRPRPGPLPASPNHSAPYNPGQPRPIFQNLSPPTPPPHFISQNSMPQNRPSVQYRPLPVSQSSPHIPASLSSNRPPQISPQMPPSSPFQYNPSYRPQFVPQNSPSPNRPPTQIAGFAGTSYNGKDSTPRPLFPTAAKPNAPYSSPPQLPPNSGNAAGTSYYNAALDKDLAPTQRPYRPPVFAGRPPPSVRPPSQQTADPYSYSSASQSFLDAIEDRRIEASKSKDPSLLVEYGKYILREALKLPPNDPIRLKLFQEGFEVIRKTADESSVKLGHPEGQFFMAECYRKGAFGASQSHEKAFQLYTQASKQGHAAATYHRALCYELGHGVKPNFAKAIALYRSAAANGITASASKLGVIHLKGLLKQKINIREALLWLKRASADASPSNPYALYALFLLGCHYEPSNIAYDRDYAFQFFLQGAELGHGPCMYKAAKCFEHGVGVAPNPQEADFWMRKARSQGIDERAIGNIPIPV